MLLCNSRARLIRQGKTPVAQETSMTKKRKRWSHMTTAELATATKVFDDPDYRPPVVKPSKKELAQLHRLQAKAAKDRFRVAVALEEDLIQQADQYAASHGMTFSELVSGALRQRMGKKSA
jgi:hypothetical protein